MLTAIERRLRVARDAEGGFTIIEVLVAMTIFAIIAAGAALGGASTLYLSQDNRSREAALNLANQALDAARSTKDVFTLDNDSFVQAIGSQQYTVSRSTSWINSDGTDNTCGAGTGVLAYKRIAVTVSWSSAAAPKQKSVVLDTLVSPSAAVSSATASTIVVGVKTATGGPNQGVGVLITALSGGAKALPAQPAATDGNGCSYALGVTPGTYRITITKAGNVDPDGTSAPFYDITTTTGGIGNKTFTYDQGLNVVVGAPLNLAGKTAKLPTSMTTTFRNSTSNTKTFSTNSMTLFPYPDGWTAIAGSYTSTCTDVDPTAWTTPTPTNLTFSPNVFADPANPATPGFNPTSTTAVTARAPMGIFDVKMSGLDTVLVATVKNTTASNGDPGCSPSTTYTFTGLTSVAATTVALPYGSWTLRGATILGGLLSSNNPTVSATTGASYVNVGTSGNVVTLDPRTVPAS